MKKSIVFLMILICVSPLLSQEIYKLNNGFTVILYENHKVPLATFQIWCKTGSIYETDFGGAGISHYVEHLLFTDTKKMKGEEIAKFMKKNGCDMNGYTSFERTVYHYTLPSENLNNIIPVVKQMIFEPGFKDDQIKKEKNVILKEINMNIDDPNRFFNKLVFSSSYEEAFYKYPVIGYRDLFNKITKKDLIKYYKRHYIPDNIAIIAAGDFNTDEIKSQIKKNFGSINRKYIKPVVLLEEPEQVGYKEVVKYRKDIKVLKIAMAWKTIDLRHEDLFSLDVLSMLLSNGSTSILNTILKEKKHYVTYINSFSYTPLKKGIFVVEAELNPGIKPEVVKKEVENILNNVEKYITKKKLKKIKQIALRDYYKNKETINKAASDLGVNWASTGNIDFSKYYADGLRKVTKKDILKVVKKYFKKDTLIFIKLLPGINIKTKEVSVNTEKISSSKVFKIKNGLNLVIHENKDLPFINISLVFKGGVMFEPDDKKGLTLFLSKMLLGGTKKKRREKLLSSIEDNGGSIYSFSGNNSFGIRIEVFKENFQEAITILKGILLESNFPEKEIKRTRMEQIQQIKASQERVFGIGKEILFKEMFKGHNYASLSTGDEDSVKRINRRDLIKHYKKLVVPGNAVLSISGDNNSDNIVKIIKDKFKKWKHKGSSIKENKFNIPESVKNKIKKHIDKTQSLILVAYYGVSVRDDDRIKAELLWQILNGQGSRLFVNIREKKGLAYYTGMFPFYGLTDGLFVYYVGTEKDKVKTAKDGIDEEIKFLIKKGITEEELKAAKKEFISNKLKAFQSNSSISFVNALDYLYKAKLTGIREYKNKADNIDLKDMNVFIKKYFFNKPSISIILEGK